MLRVVICEDEAVQRDILKEKFQRVLEDITNQYEILVFGSGEELLDNYEEGIDIILLDIQMDKLNGMDVARKIREFDNNVEIIFTTSLVDYVQEGYEVRAYRYLLKPIKYDDLKKHAVSCIDDIIKKRENYIIIECKGIINKIPINKITCIEVRKKDMTIYTIDGVYFTRMSINKIEKEVIKYKFFRCHKSYIINMTYIESINKNIVVVNGEDVPVSKYRINNLKTKLAYVLGDVLC